MYTYLLRFSGHYLGGELLVTDINREEAFKKAMEELTAQNLDVKNKYLTLEDLQWIDTTKKFAYIIDNGDY